LQAEMVTLRLSELMQQSRNVNSICFAAQISHLCQNRLTHIKRSPPL